MLVIMWTIGVMVLMGTICAWGIRSDDRRRSDRDFAAWLRSPEGQRLLAKINRGMENASRAMRRFTVSVEQVTASMLALGRALAAAGRPAEGRATQCEGPT